MVVSLLLAELPLRLLGVHFDQLFWTDPYRGVAHVPGAKSAQQIRGARSSRSIGTASAVLIFRSSTRRGPSASRFWATSSKGFQVPFEKTVGEIIAREMSARRGQPVQVLNFGVGGYGTTQELLTLRHDVWKYAPDLVVLGVTTGNDISDNSRALKHYDYVPYYVFQGTIWCSTQASAPRPRTGPETPGSSPSWRRCWNTPA